MSTHDEQPATDQTLPSVDFLMLQLKLKGFWMRRSLGQHFLTDQPLLERIADAAGLDRQTLAVEIGPGAGLLTTSLAQRAGGVLAVELDERLRPIHTETFGNASQVEFVYADALRIDLADQARRLMEKLDLNRLVLTGNIPFQITSPLLFGQCGPLAPWKRMTLMVQREVADRIVGCPGTKAYGILTVKLAYWWRVVERFEVPAARFFPRPKVDAAVLVFEPIKADRTPPLKIWPGLSAFIDAAFGQRRKMLINSLAGRWAKFPGKARVLEALESQGIPPQVRAEALNPDQLQQIYLSSKI